MTMVGAQFSYWNNSRYSIKWRYLAYLTVIMTLLVLGYFRSAEEFQGYTMQLPSDINISIYRPLQPEVEDDFPTVPEGPAKIPHLLHQTSKTTCVYKENIKYMQSFITLNKGWTYYFWTDTTARALIVEKYKELLELYDGVERGVKRGDLLRYVVMYEFGGVYADTDIENLRPLDRVTRKYSCILPTEPVEQSILLRGLPYMISNAIMLCSPKHPFFKMLLDNIFRSINLRDVVAATGPKFVTEQYNAYNNFFLDISRMSSEELRMKDFLPIGSGQYKTDTQLGIFIPNTHYFVNDLDIKLRGKTFVSMCNNFFNLTELHRRACVELQTKGLVRIDEKYTYTKHHWHHSWSLSKWKSLFKTCVEVSRVIPNINFYKTN